MARCTPPCVARRASCVPEGRFEEKTPLERLSDDFDGPTSVDHDRCGARNLLGSPTRTEPMSWEPCVLFRCHRITTPEEEFLLEGTLPIRTVQPPGLRFGKAGKKPLVPRAPVTSAGALEFGKPKSVTSPNRQPIDHPVYRLVNGGSDSFG